MKASIAARRMIDRMFQKIVRRAWIRDQKAKAAAQQPVAAE